MSVATPSASAGAIEASARATARAKFSWHLVRCAVDLRNRHYTPAQCEVVLAWLRARCEQPFYEVVQHDVGAGNHIHLGRRDFIWRRRYTPEGDK